MITHAEISDLTKNAIWERDHVGAPGCIIRKRAESLLNLIDAYLRLESDNKDLENENARLHGHIIDFM